MVQYIITATNEMCLTLILTLCLPVTNMFSISWLSKFKRTRETSDLCQAWSAQSRGIMFHHIQVNFIIHKWVPPCLNIWIILTCYGSLAVNLCSLKASVYHLNLAIPTSSAPVILKGDLICVFCFHSFRISYIIMQMSYLQ